MTAAFESRRARALTVAAILALFLLANRAAYRGWFQDDDLDNLSWTRFMEASGYLKGLVSPQIQPGNFRPMGHGYLYVVEKFAGLRFPPYLAVLHLVELANIALVWLLARKLGLGAVGAAAAALFFAFHPALFDAWYKPMYVFDALCALCSLLSILAWSHRRWVLSFACFWLAYKSKEQAVMLPLALAAWEFWLGEKKWKWLAPFFLASLSFGVQALWSNAPAKGDYALSLAPAGLWKALAFYSSDMLLAPYAGLLTLALFALSRDRRVRFGVASLWVFLTPMLLLSNRLFSVYLYLPAVGLSLALAALAEGRLKRPWVWVAAFFAVWIPENYLHQRAARARALAGSEDNRNYVRTLGEFAGAHPDIRTFLYDALPAGMHPWGVKGALNYLRRCQDLEPLGVAEAGPALEGSFAALNWNTLTRRLEVVLRVRGQPEQSYISLAQRTPFWQLETGWYPQEGRFRWTEPRAVARLERPAGARAFEVVANLGPEFIRDVGVARLEVTLNGQPLGEREFRQAGQWTARWELAPGPPGPVKVEFRAMPSYHAGGGDTRVLGSPLVAFGFVGGTE